MPKHSFSQSTSVSSALWGFEDEALYKSTFYITLLLLLLPPPTTTTTPLVL